ncbi:MAG: preprotein translocase subunit SecE [Dehalococcoidia bacterium]|nr:preprotein translocase subunit SecE [Dehalococcoidia bacterium]MSQ17774.1 preprotein translocase subunit SecE [Dehalococcoidia bacterium]
MARVTPRPARPVNPRNLGKMSPITFLQETVSELRKSVWPSREETVRLTIVVIATAIAMGFFLGGLDRGLAALFTWLILS